MAVQHGMQPTALLESRVLRLMPVVDMAESSPLCLMRQNVGNGFTKLQGQYLAFITAYVKLHGRSPAEADFQRYFKVTPPSVHHMIVTLERRGLIARVPGQARSIELRMPLDQLPALKGRDRA